MSNTKLKIRRIDTFTEKRIITGLIVSKEFNQQILPVMQLAYFQSNYTRKVAEWCLEFFDIYEDAPFEHIQDIFEQRSSELNEEADIVKALLIDINKRYEAKDKINVPYLVDKTIEFFKKRELEITSGNIKILLDRNDLEGAEEQIHNYSKIARISADWSDTLDPKYIDEVFQVDNKLFKFFGDMGRYMGAFDRGWLVAIAAGFKVGKTFLLQEFAIQAMIKRLNVAFISLEMSRKDMNERIYKRLLGAATDVETEGIFPIFDCYLNQTDACDREDRTCHIALRDEDGIKPNFDQNSPYVPCTVCRNDPIRHKEFVMDTWFERVKVPPFTEYEVGKKIKELSKFYDKKLMFKTYPRFSANVDDIMRDLDVLEKTDNFIPDMIIVDYADILKDAGGIGGDGINKMDDTWKTLSRLAGERHAIVVTASQINRGGLSKDQVEQQDLAMWIGKLAHVDAMYTINQTAEEKRLGISKIGTMVKRFEDSHSDKTCTILQNLKHGQFSIDSYF